MNRDKRTVRGQLRFARVVDNHVVLLPACDGNLSEKWRCGRDQDPDGVCSSCRGARLTANEKLHQLLLD